MKLFHEVSIAIQTVIETFSRFLIKFLCHVVIYFTLQLADPDQPRHQLSLIRVFAVHMRKA